LYWRAGSVKILAIPYAQNALGKVEDSGNIVFMQKLVTIFCLLVFIVILPPSVAQTEDEGAEETSHEGTVGPKPDTSWLLTLRFVTTTGYPPFNYRDENSTLTGFNVDLARAICTELEVTNCEVDTVEWSKLPEILKNNKADAVIASIAITPQTTTQYDFTNSYYATPAKFVTRSSSELKKMTPETLEGHKIAVVVKTAHEAYLRNFFADSKIVAFPTSKEAREALKKEKVDLLFGDAISLMFWVNGSDSGRCCQIRGEGFFESEYFGEGVGIAVKKGNIRLQEVLNYGLARVRASHRLEELQLRYFPLPIY
jgi:polar amino acid transport system substrate-binding protein